MLYELIEHFYAARPDQPLYHYTSLQGLLGITNSKVLWATDIRYLNDAEELRHFGKLLDVEIMRRLEQEPPAANVLLQLRRWLPERIGNGPMLFVASFTENGNLLSQWRGYCPHGKGVSVGFDARLLITTAEIAAFRIGKCVYDHASHSKAAASFVDAAVTAAYEDAKAHPSQSYHGSFERIEHELLQIAALMKSGSFHEEREWRFVSPVFNNYVEPPIKYREGVSTLVPYLEMPLPVNYLGKEEIIALHSVIVGPTPNANLSLSAISRFLSKEGVRPTVVHNSLVPYRQT